MIPVNTPVFRGNEKKYLNDCIDTGWISSEGKYVDLFEKSIAEIADREYGVAVSSGTAALDIIIDYLNLCAGDEVILPSFTIFSCVQQILRSGATPIFIDADPITWNVTADLIKPKISAKTKAILIVHIYGHPVDADPIIELSQQEGIFLIEDAAEMHGQFYKDRPCGSLGHVSMFSFYPNKHITTGEGGMIVTNDTSIADHAKSARNLCFKNPRYVHDRIGWNYRMSNLQAAVGLAQCEQLAVSVQRKREIGFKYRSAFEELSNIYMLPVQTSYSISIDWVFGILLEESLVGKREFITEGLSRKGIGNRPFFHPLHKQPIVLEKHPNQPSLPVAENLGLNGFYIPCGIGITNAEIEIVINSVKEVLNENL
jgi:perosamine synthetase